MRTTASDDELPAKVAALQRENGLLRARLANETKRADAAEESARRAWALQGRAHVGVVGA
jgi:hypothetical protein